MYTNFNPRTMGLNQYSYEKQLVAAGQAGFKGIEVPAGAFGTPEKARFEKEKLDRMGMRFGLIMAPCDLYKVTDQEFETALKEFDQWAHLARIAGCERAYNHIWSGSNDRDYEENFEWHIRRLTLIYRVLRDNGIRYGLEFMGAQTIREQFIYEFVCSLMGVVSLTREVSSEIGFVFDTIHWYTSGSRKDDLYYAAKHPGQIINLHLCDANASREKQIDAERGMPMENGIINSVEIVKLLGENGYDGPVIIEPMKPTTTRYETMPLEAAASEAISCLHAIFDAAGVSDDA
ncbi:sugar phosphate isomerase [Bacteroidia bacterium]|nr:sugar phosphate isomerase [Bacteroidia bacterium]